jgi:hypothetical protein
MVDFVRRRPEKPEVGAGRLIEWLDIAAGKYYDWREGYGKVREHSGRVPRCGDSTSRLPTIQELAGREALR